MRYCRKTKASAKKSFVFRSPSFSIGLSELKVSIYSTIVRFRTHEYKCLFYKNWEAQYDDTVYLLKLLAKITRHLFRGSTSISCNYTNRRQGVAKWSDTCPIIYLVRRGGFLHRQSKLNLWMFAFAIISCPHFSISANAKHRPLVGRKRPWL